MLTDLPNLLTLSRIIVVPLVVGLVVLHTPQTDCAACVLFILAGITDYLDGKLARAWNQNSDLGRMLDPIADKLLVGASLMVMAGLGRLPYGCLYPAIIILSREILVSGLREYLAATRVGLPVTRLAKWKTGFQMTAIGFLLAGDSTAGLLHIGWLPVNALGAIMMWIAAVLTLITGWDYLSTGLRHVSGAGAGATKLSS
ncbi:CDP-diacylglycerol--glycerol-3-phosphate 3-phosphatidyltransferase [Gluconacetobacter sp. SXCC-1]|uniref:CDP-diacylglycerol--glycerol-3-phosphate 3-phosphatidyltransferase n=1 Tax=Komagataeibacter rhaeticus TaxID=215221 RepID=A0A181CBE7_9PROT|nr:CDP-diacylglycerol--glycerol-3-phosphate 3-phosphatidyltransferase [Komagataeibacter rhaeticus]ATU72473.1 CDP-diacylglycerol--glycerol-3-phosphate 3-phosphatidyltransferase [Komagataeibacter xylinus]EGG74806.1 CDP-diacylglycerol--glycerol-3-phosphate 3-phosphatidyltransferase [Gluconacetobacter sp. SXCC-1]QIP35613.1 CDP-diacylglycerol--glycerol-3-phosphate 3-phosphatidyltransferase [Komagataeibacter rhaeticus]QOC45370.1 CDP-diacylglycerol--glycerol-3-phosphate 3-phosphatidyltransferase [Koma